MTHSISSVKYVILCILCMLCLSRYLSLEESSVFVNNIQKSYATGYLSSSISTYGNNASFVVIVDDRITATSEVSQLYTNSFLTWHLYEQGDITMNSKLIFSGTERWNTSALVQYGDNKYLYFAAEELAAFLCAGRGGYGGTLMDW